MESFRETLALYNFPLKKSQIPEKRKQPKTPYNTKSRKIQKYYFEVFCQVFIVLKQYGLRVLNLII